MSAKDMLYGIVSMVVPNCTGLDGGTYTGYLVDVNLFTDPLLGNSIKGTTFSVGDVVTIIQCGESLAFGGTDVPMHGWAFCEYSYSYPSVYQVPNAAIARSICTDPRYSASVSMNWICRHSGAVDSLYWPGRITAISGSTVTVCDQFGAGAYQMPVSSDLAIGDFSVGDYVLVYSPTSGAEVIGWWMMAPTENNYWIYEYTAPDTLANTYAITFNSGTTPELITTDLALVVDWGYSYLVRFWCQNDPDNIRPSYANRSGNQYMMYLFLYSPPDHYPMRTQASFYPGSMERLYLPKPSNGWNTAFPFTITIGGTHTFTINSSSDGDFQQAAVIPGIDPQT